MASRVRSRVSKASSTDATTPASTSVRAMCGRPIDASPATSATRSQLTGTPSAAIRSVIRSARPSRLSRSAASAAASPGCAGSTR